MQMDCKENQMIDLNTCYAIIAKARDYHIYNQQRDIIDKTRQTYNKTAERLIFKDKCLPIDCAKSKSSYYVYKAAVSSYVLDKISDALFGMDALKKESITDWKMEVDKLKQYLDFLEVVGVDQKKSKLADAINGTYQSAWNSKAKKTPKRVKKSKSKRLKSLPKNWTSKIFEVAIKSKTIHLDAISVLSISGCRPQELSFGVLLGLNHDGSINILIKGAKTHQGRQYGQKWRSFSIKNDSAEFEHLVHRLEDNKGELYVHAEAGAVCDKISYLSRKAMPQLKEAATAYCYRHRFSGSLHKANLDSESISKALGHSSDQSKQHYSSSYRSSSSGFFISNILSASPVKMKNSIRSLSKKSTYEPPLKF
ncbi:hypothetical protein QZJ86_04155 [Methylomonas montana]|uniref:hypothetical protein n=1 Tax=Methylomonas montana TaxID=3058963 RepID=UPI0026597196|nr:hypothetical protein [Methylomonas montana]WKJ91329.1 hypothetical protein QZJ86_04155 [Methylomonas montana]